MKLTKQNLLWSLLFGGKGGGGITPSGTLSITSNGTYDVGAFAEASVLVPASAVVSGTKQISANGTHDVTAFASAEVLVPASAVDSGTKSISANGTHDVVGFANVDVNVGGGSSNEDAIIDRTISGMYENSILTAVGDFAFCMCSNLVSVSFPNCTKIAQSAFGSCYSLTTAWFPACTQIARYAFNGCSALTTVSFSTITSMSGSAFMACGLTTLSMSVHTIPSSTFYMAAQLTTIYLPITTGVYSSAFARCNRLRSVYLLGSTVAYLQQSGVFSSTPIAGYTTYTDGELGSIYVRSSLYSTYIASTNWSWFASRFVSLTDAQVAAILG